MDDQAAPYPGSSPQGYLRTGNRVSPLESYRFNRNQLSSRCETGSVEDRGNLEDPVHGRTAWKDHLYLIIDFLAQEELQWLVAVFIGQITAGEELSAAGVILFAVPRR